MAAIPVNVDNFARAETDRMFAAIAAQMPAERTRGRTTGSPPRSTSSR